MLIAQLGHIGARACVDWLGAKNEDERTFAEAWFAEFLDDPHTVDQIEITEDTA